MSWHSVSPLCESLISITPCEPSLFSGFSEPRTLRHPDRKHAPLWRLWYLTIFSCLPDTPICSLTLPANLPPSRHHKLRHHTSRSHSSSHHRSKHITSSTWHAAAKANHQPACQQRTCFTTCHESACITIRSHHMWPNIMHMTYQ